MRPTVRACSWMGSRTKRVTIWPITKIAVAGAMAVTASRTGLTTPGAGIGGGSFFLGHRPPAVRGGIGYAGGRVKARKAKGRIARGSLIGRDGDVAEGDGAF